MLREEVVQRIREAAVKDRLSCEHAHALSQQLGVSLREIGLICNEQKIKISSCQLGCF